MVATLGSDGTICNSCGRGLAGPVEFCPFCGNPSLHEPVQTSAAPNVGADEVVSEANQIWETDIETPPVAEAESQPETQNPETAANRKKAASDNISPEPAPLTSLIESPKIFAIPNDVRPPSQDMRAGSTKKSMAGLYAAISLVGVVLIVGAFKFFAPVSSAKTAEVRIISIPQGATVTIDGSEVGKTPHLAVKMIIGTHTVGFWKHGYKSRSVEASLVAGYNPDILMELERVQQSKDVAQPSSSERPPKAYSVKQAPQPAGKAPEKPVEERIQEGINLYESKQYRAAVKLFDGVLSEVPNNATVKYYLQKSRESLN